MRKITVNRVMAIAPSTRGFGYAVIDGDKFVDWGTKTAKGADRNQESVKKAEHLMAMYLPNTLVLANHDGTRRVDRIINLTEEIAALAGVREIKVRRYTRAQVHRVLVSDAKATKREVAEALAEMFPAELKPHLPPKRLFWENESSHVDTFEAVALALVPVRKRQKTAQKKSLATEK